MLEKKMQIDFDFNLLDLSRSTVMRYETGTAAFARVLVYSFFFSKNSAILSNEDADSGRN